MELIVEIYDIIHIIYCNNKNLIIVDVLEDSKKDKKKYKENKQKSSVPNKASANNSPPFVSVENP